MCVFVYTYIHFLSKDTVMATVKQWAISASAKFCECGMKNLVHIANSGDYVL